MENSGCQLDVATSDPEMESIISDAQASPQGLVVLLRFVLPSVPV